MLQRVAGACAMLGGVAWLIKVGLIWANGGTNTTDGMVGVFFSLGFAALTIAVLLRGWSAPVGPSSWRRAGAALLGVLLLVALVDLPISLAWLVVGNSWVAAEVGIVLAAMIAVPLGRRWLTKGFRTGWPTAGLQQR